MQYLWDYTRKLSTIASRATPIGSTSRAPDDDGNIDYWPEDIIDFIVDNMKIRCFSPIGRNLRLVKRKTTRRFWVLEQPNKDHDKFMILKLCHCDKKSLNIVVAKIMKVRPQDPSCMAKYMHMNALC
jgi:hypothetical protein